MYRATAVIVILVGVLLLGGVLVTPFLHAQAAAATKHRDPEDILKDETALNDQITLIMPSLRQLADPDFRAGDGQKALPLMRKLVDTTRELEASAREKDIPDLLEAATVDRYNFMAFAIALGDKDTAAALEADAKGTGDAALSARCALALGHWFEAGKDADAQQKVLGAFTPIAHENPSSPAVFSVMSVMANVGTAGNDVQKKIIEVIRANLKGQPATELLVRLDAAQVQLTLIGKPLPFAGRTSTGGHFSSADYKGKVVLVDFWATWCDPCVEAIPEVKKIYADQHAKGLEIVGISWDSSESQLNSFVADKKLPWVQLHETTQNEDDNKHPLAKKWSVAQLPTMFLIDRKGLLRYVDARDDLDKKVAELVAEKD